MQAVHDLLFLGPRNLKQFDHVLFPGVVPRTFLAPAAVAAAAWLPLALLLRSGAIAKLAAGVFSRATLALFSVAALSRLRGAVEAVHGRRASAFLALLTALQFHLPFYASRALPNTFATVVTTAALADWIDGSAPRRALVLLAAAAAALRCDVVLLAGVVGLHVLATATLPFLSAVAASLAGGLGAAAASVAVDSYFWGRGALSEAAEKGLGCSMSEGKRRSAFVWPELMVLLFNAPSSGSSGGPAVVSSASSRWGTSPWHWYLSSALPRALGAAGGFGLLWAVLFSSKKEEKETTNSKKTGKKKAAAAVVSARHAAAVAAGFVALYSFLPHKELRFLMPVLPLFNVVAAVGLADAWGGGGDGDGDEEGGNEAARTTRAKKQKAGGRRRGGLFSLATLLLVRSLAAAALAATAATTGLSLAAASRNYPGGVALERLHALVEEEEEEEKTSGGGGGAFTRRLVHIDVAAAQQGVTRFGERWSSLSASASPYSWSYSKDEALKPEDLLGAGFTHLVSELASVPGFDAVEAVEGFSGLRLVVVPAAGAAAGEENEEVVRPSPGALLRALRKGSVPRLRLATEPRIYLHRRRREAEAEGGGDE